MAYERIGAVSPSSEPANPRMSFRLLPPNRFGSMMAAMVTKLLSIGLNEVRKFVPKLWGMARELFHEVTGFIFFAFAAFFTFGSEGLISNFQNMDTDPNALLKLVAVGLFVATMLGFGISSFRRAKRIARDRSQEG